MARSCVEIDRMTENGDEQLEDGDVVREETDVNDESVTLVLCFAMTMAGIIHGIIGRRAANISYADL